jgi:hypothetical protein
MSRDGKVELRYDTTRNFDTVEAWVNSSIENYWCPKNW